VGCEGASSFVKHSEERTPKADFFFRPNALHSGFAERKILIYKALVINAYKILVGKPERRDHF
jgi:hypothetical protein